MHIEFLINQRWKDPRLDSDDRTRRLAVNGQIWQPKIISTEGEYNEIKDSQFWRGLSPSGNILYSEKIILKTFCSTQFANFPFDTQYCIIKLSSCKYNGCYINKFNIITVLTSEH